jgi:hypothetical protein
VLDVLVLLVKTASWGFNLVYIKDSVFSLLPWTYIFNITTIWRLRRENEEWFFIFVLVGVDFLNIIKTDIAPHGFGHFLLAIGMLILVVGLIKICTILNYCFYFLMNLNKSSH